jgi:hypothetical protein
LILILCGLNAATGIIIVHLKEQNFTQDIIYKL